MPVWRNARLRRLYGKPDDPIEDPGTSAGSRKVAYGLNSSRRGSQEPADGSDGAKSSPTPPPPPKRIKREKTRPESEYQLVHGMPVTPYEPDYALLTAPLPESKAKIGGYAVHLSRQNWLNGPMFETFWTRKPRGKKLGEGQVNLRERMTKLYECSVTLGPHTFPVKLFTVRDDTVHIDEEEDAKVEEILKEREPKPEPKPEPAPTEVKQELDSTNPMEVGNKDSNEDSKKEESKEESKDESKKDSKDESKDTSTPQENTSENSNDRKDKEVSNDQPNEGPKGATNDTEDASKDDPKEATQEESNVSSKEDSSESAQKGTDETETNKDGPAEETHPDQNAKENSNESKEVPENQTPKKNTSKSKSELKRKAPASKGKKKVKVEFDNEKDQLSKDKERNTDLESKLKTSEGTPKAGPSAPEPSSSGNASASTETPSDAPAPTSEPDSASVPAPEPGAAPSNNPEPAPAPSGPPPPGPSQAPPSAPPNQVVVFRLQQMAARDPTLGELMKQVASGTASPDSIAKFQDIITQVKLSIFNPPKPPKQKKGGEPSSPGYKQTPVNRPMTYQPRPNARAIMLAIEFDESPSERFLLPKRSILEYDPEKEELLWSFLHVAEPESKNEKPKYTPFTAIFHDIPLRIAQTLDRCVRRPRVVRYYMEEEMKRGERADPWHIWFQIEKNDEILVDMVKKMNPPYMPAPPVIRKPTRPRKQRPNIQLQMQQQQEQQRQAWLNYNRMLYFYRLKRGQPLAVQTGLPNVRGQPHIQMPSYRQRNFGQIMPMPMPMPMYPMYQPVPMQQPMPQQQVQQPPEQPLHTQPVRTLVKQEVNR